MEKVYEVSEKKTRTAVAKVNLQALGWSEAETKAFENYQTAVANQTTLPHRDEEKGSVFTQMQGICFGQLL